MSEHTEFRPFEGADGSTAAASPSGLRSLASAVPAVPAFGDLDVATEKLDAVAAVVEQQAQALQRELAGRLGQLHIDAPSEDIVSVHAVEGWNQLVADGEQSYATRVRAYVRSLHDLVGALRAAARKYQLHEDDAAHATASAGGERVPPA